MSLKLVYYLLCAGLFLMPFSTPPRSAEGVTASVFPWFGDLGVVHFGLPFLGLAGLAFILVMLGEKELIARSAIMPLVAGAVYLGCIVGFTFLAPDIVVSGARAVVNVLGFLVFFVILKIGTEPKKSRSDVLLFLARSFVISGVVLAAYFLLNLAVQGTEYEQVELFGQRYVGGIMGLPWGASNTIASALLMPLVISFAYFELIHRARFFAISAGMIIAAIMLTFSRNGLMCVTLFCGFYWLCITRNRILLVILLAAAMVAILEWLARGASIDFLLDTRVRDVDELLSFNRRIDLWGLFFEYLQVNPFDPVGYYGSLGTFEISPHNWFLCTYVEMGPIGVVVALVFLGMAVYRSIRAIHRRATVPKQTIKVLLSGLAVIFLNLQFEDPQYTQPYIIYFWTFMALYFSLLSNPVRIGQGKPFRFQTTATSTTQAFEAKTAP